MSRALAGGALEMETKASRIAEELWRKKCLLNCLTAWQTWRDEERWSGHVAQLAE